ncbi:MAG: glycine cleavage system protein H [Firmicutes bacterium]|nr:glycine cleavage system protein H [Bacillota bacterium]
MQFSYDKFTFTVKKGYFYHPNECWAKEENGLIVVGLSDFLQITAGDVAFLESPELGAEVKRGDSVGVIETIKTTVTLISPVSGTVKEVNEALEGDPQLINTDPYGEGWVLKIVPADWEADKKELMDAEAYFPIMEEKVKAQMEKK